MTKRVKPPAADQTSDGERAARASPPGPAQTLLLALAGAAVGIATLTIAARTTPASTTFAKTPPFGVWVAVVAGQTAFWAVTAAVFAGSLRAMRVRYRIDGRGAWPTTVIVAAVLLVTVLYPVVFRGSRLHSNLVHHSYRVAFLGILGTGVATVGVQAIARVYAAAAQIAAPKVAVIDQYLFLREELQRLVYFLGAMIGAATLASGALRYAVTTDKGGVKPSDFPVEFVLAYGGFFTFLIAAIYAPTYAAVREVGHRIRDEICGQLPTNPRDASAWGEWQSQRTSIASFLELDVSIAQRLRTALAILAPVAGSAVSLLFAR